jgi:hypothetical protein
MSVDTWEWTCTGCGAVFLGETAADAQSKFFVHVGIVHPKAHVFSFNSEEH